MITYLIGDATYPQGEGQKIIAHIVNDIGAWGAGFVLALDQRWTWPRQAYLTEPNLVLGQVQFVNVAKDIVVANMIAQRGVRSRDNEVPVRYDALREALERVRSTARFMGASIHMPRIGSGLGGGDWPTIEGIIEEVFNTRPVFVYDLPSETYACTG